MIMEQGLGLSPATRIKDQAGRRERIWPPGPAGWRLAAPSRSLYAVKTEGPVVKPEGPEEHERLAISHAIFLDNCHQPKVMRLCQRQAVLPPHAESKVHAADSERS